MTANQRGIIHLFPLLLVVAVGLVLLFLVATGKLKLPGGVKLPGAQKEPTVAVKTEYKNPFKKEAQYVNPFDEYKSPFLNVK